MVTSFCVASGSSGGVSISSMARSLNEINRAATFLAARMRLAWTFVSRRPGEFLQIRAHGFVTRVEREHLRIGFDAPTLTRFEIHVRPPVAMLRESFVAPLPPAHEKFAPTFVAVTHRFFRVGEFFQ